MGRMTQDNIVDIDLGKEGRANKVSRQQVRAGDQHVAIVLSVSCLFEVNLTNKVFL